MTVIDDSRWAQGGSASDQTLMLGVLCGQGGDVLDVGGGHDAAAEADRRRHDYGIDS